MAAARTLLTCVLWIYVNYDLSGSFSLVLQECTELTERPSSYHLPYRLSKFSLYAVLSDVLEVLQCEHTEVRADKKFTDAVVDVLNKTIFPSAYGVKTPYGGSGAF
jgi:hypothetical protein